MKNRKKKRVKKGKGEIAKSCMIEECEEGRQITGCFIIRWLVSQGGRFCSFDLLECVLPLLQPYLNRLTSLKPFRRSYFRVFFLFCSLLSSLLFFMCSISLWKSLVSAFASLPGS